MALPLTNIKILIFQAIQKAATLPAEVVAGHKFLIGNSRGVLTTKEFFSMMSKHTGIPCPSYSLNLYLGYGLGCALSSIATNITGQEPLLPIDIMRTAKWGGIEYDCSKSEKILGIVYTPIETAVAESIADVQARTGT
jgi:hypothetical protein